MTIYNDVKYICADLALKRTDHFCSHFLDGSDITKAHSGDLISPGQDVFSPAGLVLLIISFMHFFKDGGFAEIQANCCA